jgi:hypothetical protein
VKAERSRGQQIDDLGKPSRHAAAAIRFDAASSESRNTSTQYWNSEWKPAPR